MKSGHLDRFHVHHYNRQQLRDDELLAMNDNPLADHLKKVGFLLWCWKCRCGKIKGKSKIGLTSHLKPQERL